MFVTVNAIKYYMKVIEKMNTKGGNILVKMVAAQNSYTIVAYPVVYHFDVSIKGEYSLENKICFELDIERELSEIGCGGGGKSRFYLSY